MKRSSKRREARKQAPVAAAKAKPQWLLWGACALAAAAAVFWAYAPAVNGPFLFDDNFLPFAVSNMAGQSLASWLGGQRPLLMASYWLSQQLSPDGTWWFHFMNVAIHLITTVLVFFIVRRLAEWARVEPARRDLLAGLAAAVFLLHPAQTEAVAYLAGRSEALSVMLAFAAFVVFLYRKPGAATWGSAAAVFLLFGAALLAKEHTIVLPALFLLTDYWWNPGFSFAGIRRNWKIYAPMVVAGLGGAWFFRNLILHAASAGFGLKDFTWYQYFFTECRALFVYLGLFLFPANLTADWDFPISHTILEHGAIVGLAVLVALAVAAWRWRRRFPLATYGWFVFLVLMAPTSSILPIEDPVAERRLYFAFLGLLLVVVDVAARVKLRPKALAAAGVAVALVAAVVTHARAAVWSDAVLLWQDTVKKSPNKWRPHFHLGSAYFNRQDCGLAVEEFQRTNALYPHDADLLVDWGLAYRCLHQPEQALEKLREAAALHPTAHVYSQIGMVLAESARYPEALETLATAEKLDPNYPETYVYRGKVDLLTGRYANAVVEYQRALRLDPTIQDARDDMQRAYQQLRAQMAK